MIGRKDESRGLLVSVRKRTQQIELKVFREVIQQKFIEIEN